MKKQYTISEEEFSTIKEAISEVLSLWQYDFIEANDESSRSMSMSKETFFDSLRREFIVK